MTLGSLTEELGRHFCPVIVSFAGTSSNLIRSVCHQAIAYFRVEKTSPFSERSIALRQPSEGFSKAFDRFLKIESDDVKSLVWSFLDVKDVGVSFLVSKLWKEVASSNCVWSSLHERMFCSQNFIPSPLTGRGVITDGGAEVCKRRCLDSIHRLFQNKMGSEFYSEYLGDVEFSVVPEAFIPEEFIMRAQEIDPFDPQGRLVKDTHQLVYIPEEITIKLPVGSNLALNEEGRLIEGLEFVSLEERTLSIPVTINNIVMLMEKSLKKGHRTQIYPLYRSIFGEFGDEQVEDHWSFVRKDAVDLRSIAQNQIDVLQEGNCYEEAPLIDLVLLNCFTYMSSGVRLNGRKTVATSTSEDGFPAVLCWAPRGGVTLGFLLPCDVQHIALRVLSGRFPALGT